MALASLLAADAYLRPGEVLWLAGEDVVPARAQFGEGFGATALLLFPEERGRASKTHMYNDSVVLDSRHRGFLNRLVEALAARRQGQALFNFTYIRWLGQFKAAAILAGLGKWDLTPYYLRHTGPSDDYLWKRRSLDEIQRRGRWAAESSVRRYEKSSRVTSRLNQLPASTLEFLRLADVRLQHALSRTGIGHLPALPRLRRSQKT